MVDAVLIVVHGLCFWLYLCYIVCTVYAFPFLCLWKQWESICWSIDSSSGMKWPIMPVIFMPIAGVNTHYNLKSQAVFCCWLSTNVSKQYLETRFIYWYLPVNQWLAFLIVFHAPVTCKIKFIFFIMFQICVSLFCSRKYNGWSLSILSFWSRCQWTWPVNL